MIDGIASDFEGQAPRLPSAINLAGAAPALQQRSA